MIYVKYTIGSITDNLILTELEFKRLMNEKTEDEEVEFEVLEEV